MGRRGRMFPRRNPVHWSKRQWKEPDITFKVFEHEYGNDKEKDLKIARSQLFAILYEMAKRQYATERYVTRWYRSKVFAKMKAVGVPMHLWYRAIESLAQDGYIHAISEMFDKEVHLLIVTKEGYEKYDAWVAKSKSD